MGRRRSTASARAFAVIYEDSFNYLSKMCLLRMREAALTMIDAARARGITVDRRGLRRQRSSGRSISIAAPTSVVAGEGEITLVEVLDALAGTAHAAR